MAVPVDPATAAETLLRRRRARRSLATFALECGFWPARHHQLLIDRLEAVARGECRRLAVFAPPGSAKSTYTSTLFPAWLLAQPSPHGMPWDVIGASHTATLAEEFSRKVRAKIRDHGHLLGLDLATDSQAVDRWATQRGDVFRAVGAGGAVTGQRADVIILDDPIRGREQADSPAQREKVWQWFVDDLRTRAKPGAALVLVQTRWHEDDVAGRILPADWDGQSGPIVSRDGETWEVVCLPALAEPGDLLGREPGEALWPEWQPVARLEQERRTLSARSWSALFQQRPAPETGGFFKREWLGRYQVAPANGLRTFLSSDWATPSGKDWTTHVVVGVDPSNKLFVLDVARGKGTTADEIDKALDLAAKHKAVCWLNEKGVLWRMIDGQASARMRERGVFIPVETYARTAEKTVVARAIQGRWSQGMVLLPEAAHWLAAFEHELLRFPAGAHDDQVDAVALVGLHLEHVVAPPRMSFQMQTAEGSDALW